MDLSVAGVVLTKNEEKNIQDCVKSLDFCDEILIIDDFSTDATIKEIKKLNNPKIKIYQHDLKSDFSAQRNYALTKATSIWVLFVDADERVPEKLKEEIQIAVLNDLTCTGFFLRRQDTLWGKQLLHGETSQIKLLRLGQKNAGKWSGAVHETWDIQGKVGELTTPIQHYPHQTVSEFIFEINHYTTVRAEELFEKKVLVSLFDIMLYPTVKFFLNYFFRLGFLDGVPGFLVAVFMSFHSFLVRSKLWLYWKKS